MIPIFGFQTHSQSAGTRMNGGVASTVNVIDIGHV